MTLGVAVIGAGMAGRAHAAAYRTAPTLYASTLPPLRYVSIADVSPELGELAARRFGYERNDTSWQALAEDPSIDVVSVVVANRLHREMVEGLLAAGKHVLCEKPLSDTLDDARAMVEAADAASTVARIGFTYRRAPGVAALRDLVQNGTLGNILHLDARYWCDYAADPQGPMAWRYKGAPGSGALADIGSHTAYLAEFLAGDITEVSGGRFITAITAASGGPGGRRRARQGRGQRHLRAGGERRLRRVQRLVRPRRRRHPGVPGGRRSSERTGAGGVRGQGCRHLGAGAAGRVPADAERGQRHRHQRLPPGDHRPRPPVRRRRSADGRPRCRSRSERRFRLPGPRVPGGGRRSRRGWLPAALCLVLRGRPQHGGPRRRRRVRRPPRRRRHRPRPALHPDQLEEISA